MKKLFMLAFAILLIVGCSCKKKETANALKIEHTDILFNFSYVEDIIYDENYGFYLEYMDSDVFDLDNFAELLGHYDLEYVKIDISEGDMPEFLDDYDRWSVNTDWNEADRMNENWYIREYVVWGEKDVQLYHTLERKSN